MEPGDLLKSDYLLKSALQLPGVVNTDNPDSSLAVLWHFSADVHDGIQPDERVMKVIASAFSQYLFYHQAVGQPKKFKTLDECFGLQSRPRSGHPVKRDNAKMITRIYVDLMREYQEAEQAKGKKITDAAAAEWVCKNYHIDGKQIDPETLKRRDRKRDSKYG